MVDQTIYTVGGTLEVGKGIYIKRKADEELLMLCRAGQLAYVLSSRQIGKSSLMVNTASELRKENILSVVIDFNLIGTFLSPDQWYQGVLKIIASTLELETEIGTWWLQHSDLGPTQRLTNFFRDVLLKEVKGNVVLFFDEIDSTLSLSFPSDDFFAALRAVYNGRNATPEFRRLSFVLLGVATPGELIADPKRTPFNIGQRVELNDFSMDEILPLVQRLNGITDQILEWVFKFTSGHPYLTQRLCDKLAESNETINGKVVERTVMSLFSGEQAKQDIHLQFVRDMILKRSPDLRGVLAIYEGIYSGENVKDEEHSILKTHLKLSGLVRSEMDFLRVRNEIYHTVFDSQWIKENTPKNFIKSITPYLVRATQLMLVVMGIILGILALSRVMVANYVISQSSSGKLESLAWLFRLSQTWINDDFAFQARNLFYDSNWDDQTKIFQDSSITLAEKQSSLSIVISGLYITMANIENEKDSSELLRIMRNSLTENSSLRNEIDLWLEARNASTDQEALGKYNQAIQLNSGNPATHYERALIAIRLERYDTALFDLDAALGLAQNLFKEQPSPPAKPVSLDGKDYRSDFSSIEDVQTAINSVILENSEDANFRTELILAKTETNKYVSLESTGLLGEVNNLVGKFATQISMVETQSSEIKAQKSTVEAQSTAGQIQILTATAQVSEAQAKVLIAEAQVSTAQALIASGIVNTNGNCRSGPSELLFPSRTVQIPKGETVEVVGKNGQGDWLKVTWTEKEKQENYECWILTNIINFDPTQIPTVLTPIPKPTSTPSDPSLRFRVSAPSQVTCPSGQQCNVHVTVRNAPSGNICVYVQPRETSGQPYYFQFSGTSGSATIGPAPTNTSFVIFAVATSSSCPGGQQGSLPSGTTSVGATVTRINNN